MEIRFSRKSIVIVLTTLIIVAGILLGYNYFINKKVAEVGDDTPVDYLGYVGVSTFPDYYLGIGEDFDNLIFEHRVLQVEVTGFAERQILIKDERYGYHVMTVKYSNMEGGKVEMDVLLSGELLLPNRLIERDGYENEMLKNIFTDYALVFTEKDFDTGEGDGIYMPADVVQDYVKPGDYVGLGYLSIYPEVTTRDEAFCGGEDGFLYECVYADYVDLYSDSVKDFGSFDGTNKEFYFMVPEFISLELITYE